MSNTLTVVAATGSVTGVLGALAMYLPAKWTRDLARADRVAADATYDMAEGLAAEVERTRNLPWYWPTDPDVTGEIVAEQVHEVLALSDRPAADEDEVGNEQPGEAVSEAPARLWARFCAWLRSAWADIRDLAKSNERRNAEFWAELSEPSVTEPVEGDADEDRWAEDAAITDGPDTAEPVNREPYRGVGRHWADGTAQYEVIRPGRHERLINPVPAQRTGDADV